MTNYSFNITRPDGLDYARILRENADKNAVLITCPKMGAGYLFIRTAFLAQFCLQDRLSVGGAYLMPSWGYLPADEGLNGLDNGWRVRVVSNSTSKDVIINELQAALDYQRRWKVEVTGSRFVMKEDMKQTVDYWLEQANQGICRLEIQAASEDFGSEAGGYLLFNYGSLLAHADTREELANVLQALALLS